MHGSQRVGTTALGIASLNRKLLSLAFCQVTRLNYARLKEAGVSITHFLRRARSPLQFREGVCAREDSVQCQGLGRVLEGATEGLLGR